MTHQITNQHETIYLINQLIDITIWGWICLIMIGQVVCNAVEIDSEDTRVPPRRRFRKLILNHHYIFKLCLLIYSAIALFQFSNQYYWFSISHDTSNPLVQRHAVWMIAGKVLEAGILTKYWKHQPRLFIAIKEEFKQVFST